MTTKCLIAKKRKQWGDRNTSSKERQKSNASRNSLKRAFANWLVFNVRISIGHVSGELLFTKRWGKAVYNIPRPVAIT